jgi:hypothetical protein
MQWLRPGSQHLTVAAPGIDPGCSSMGKHGPVAIAHTPHLPHLVVAVEAHHLAPGASSATVGSSLQL